MFGHPCRRGGVVHYAWRARRRKITPAPSNAIPRPAPSNASKPVRGSPEVGSWLDEDDVLVATGAVVVDDVDGALE
jgi:hypothetical protein